MQNEMNLGKEIHDCAIRCGFDNCGIITVDEMDEFEEWVCGCDNCQDICPHNRRHDWNDGEDFSNLKEIAASILPDNFKIYRKSFCLNRLYRKKQDICKHQM